MKIHKIQGDITKEIVSEIKDYCSIDCEMQGLQPLRDKLSMFFPALFIRICNALIARSRRSVSARPISSGGVNRNPRYLYELVVPLRIASSFFFI